MKLAYQCMSNPNHVFKGKSMDGVKCPICRGPASHKPYDEKKHSEIPEYSDLTKPSKPFPQKNNKSLLTITVDADTSNLSAKLKAIAKHAEALANELDAIDKTCDDCGGPITIREEYLNHELINTYRECTQCQTGECIPNK